MSFFHSADGLDQSFENMYQSYNMTFEMNNNITWVKLAFYRMDGWCLENLDSCYSTWRRLTGLMVAVGNSSTGVLKSCGRIDDYEVPALNATTDPEPIYQGVNCGGISGDRLVLIQTRAYEILQVSEIYIYTGV